MGKNSRKCHGMATHKSFICESCATGGKSVWAAGLSLFAKFSTLTNSRKFLAYGTLSETGNTVPYFHVCKSYFFIQKSYVQFTLRMQEIRY